MIELRGVSKLYRGRAVVDALSLKVESGERLVLFGPSGCGKSTILLMIAGLVIPDRGEIRIDGEIVAASGRNWRPPHERGIGMVFQDLALWPHLTVARISNSASRPGGSLRKSDDNASEKLLTS